MEKHPSLDDAGSTRRRGRKGRHLTSAPEPGTRPERAPESQELSFRFDPYWDEVFCSYYDPTLRTCCRL